MCPQKGAKMADTTQKQPDETPEKDKVEQVETEGVEQEGSTSPEAEETVETTEDVVKTEEEKEREAEESLLKTLMEKKGFKSEEDLAKSYAELEAQFSKKSQEAKELDKLLNALLEDETSPEGETIEVDETERLKADVNLMKAAQLNPDLYEYADEMKKIVEDKPEVRGLFRTADGVELLYKIAKAEKAEELISKAKEEGRKEVVEKEIEKVKGQVASDTKPKKSSDKKLTREYIASIAGTKEYEERRDEILQAWIRGEIE